MSRKSGGRGIYPGKDQNAAFCQSVRGQAGKNIGGKKVKQLRELYEYREMIFSLVKKDLRGRYKGSVLGFLWTFINPLLQLVVFTLVFSVIMKAGYEQYYMFLFVALVPWMFLLPAYRTVQRAF